MSKEAKKIKISVVMPSMNEEKAIGPMIEQIRLHTQAYDTEIILVDSSKDRTPEIARSMMVTVIQQPPRGHGLALRAAIQAATHDIIITSDCDNTYPMEYIPKLVSMITEEGYSLISCNRLTKSLKKEMPILNKFGNWTFAFLVRNLYGIAVHDVTTGMFCMTREVAQSLNWETNYSFPCEIIVRGNLSQFKYKEIDIPYRMRIGEVTLNRWRSGKAYLLCIFKYRFNLEVSPSQL